MRLRDSNRHISSGEVLNVAKTDKPGGGKEVIEKAGGQKKHPRSVPIKVRETPAVNPKGTDGKK
jgi:hypothetical protein